MESISKQFVENIHNQREKFPWVIRVNNLVEESQNLEEFLQKLGISFEDFKDLFNGKYIYLKTENTLFSIEGAFGYFFDNECNWTFSVHSYYDAEEHEYSTRATYSQRGSYDSPVEITYTDL